jgi:hypothetical protein
MRAIVALLTVAATVAGCAGAQTAGGVRGTVATVDWPNALVLLRDVRSAETGTPVVGRPAQQITVPPSTIVIERQPARFIVQQAPAQVEVKPAGRRAQPRPWCDGAYTFTAGTNFAKCAKTEDSAKSSETTGSD